LKLPLECSSLAQAVCTEEAFFKILISTFASMLFLAVRIIPVLRVKSTMDQMDSQQRPDKSSSLSGRFGSISLKWKKIVAGFVLADIIGVWMIVVRIIQHTPARARGLRSSVFIGAIALTVIGIVAEEYLLPGIIARAGKKVALFLVVFLLALYVFYPAIVYLRGDDDRYLASIAVTDGQKLQDAQRVAATLKVLSGNERAYRVELSKRDYTRLKQHRYRIHLLQSPDQQYRVERINARPPGLPDRNVERMIHSISSDSLMHQIQMLERFGTRVDHFPQADSAADYIANTMRRYGLEVESIPFESPGPRYVPVDAASSWSVSRNICGTLNGTGPTNAECIIVAHYDSANSSVPGANDNASGVAAVLEAARICSRYKFEYTIRFLAVGAEEEGLIGSYHYAHHAKAKGRNIVVAVNGDMLGYPIVGDINRMYLSVGIKCPALMDSALAYNRRYNLNFLVDGQIGGDGGSDHESFIEAGFPAVDISEGTAFEIWDRMDPYYHSPFDTSDKLNAELLRHCAQLMMAITTEMAKPLPSLAGGRW
jgi:hypothetical protein